ncbi:DsbA family protein [Streptomyces qinzhouensis]|uniref:Disulfide bond formation protein DsbA n=1 Tax=Streptomyces qinzhouensis TaxID=2599401 RepID=A0A5B8J7B1_9ACTN|nr:thioredoxin domain-containing protein [Streptomyces qinzhouensis]QDY77685.1 disulfide bond formation protein DsbA [Streptomyces qinzhouensis]
MPSIPATQRKPLLIGAGVLTAALVLGIASYTATRPEDPAATVKATGTASPAASRPGEAPATVEEKTGAYPELEKLARREAGDGLAVGRADAPVVMIEYADFQCGFCGKFARDTEPELIKKYVDQGKLRIEWRNFPIFGEPSENAARGAWAASRQGKFWEFHAAAYAKGAKEKGFSADRVKQLAEQAGVPDPERFATDLESDAAKRSVKRDQDEAYALGATSTPSFLINGRPIAGAQPEQTFTDAIESALKSAGGTGAAKSGGSAAPGDGSGS